MTIVKGRTGLILGLTLLLVAVLGVAGLRWWQGRAPYGPEALGARATLEITDQATADAALAPVNAMFADGQDDQIILGRVTWNRPPETPDGASLRIVLLDQRRHLLPGFIAVTSPDPDHVFTGMDGAVNAAEKRYPWLWGASGSGGSVITVGSMGASPVTFQTVLRAGRQQAPPEHRVATAPVAVPDLLVALILVSPEGQVHWAQRLLH